ncbi:Na/Pi cotransporter family protein [Variovorax sp. YR216]|uniref:Na/Pi cotransporter family protein n=1 Tax=Variovorax sp. YR216 TaxID=1882828 RepID=UPI00089834C5|nr:Na/Pi symporter [Variovorax sp. YR216]SEA18199.1 phosphate:Na+ symporter [Variovorax sp. YR216]
METDVALKVLGGLGLFLLGIHHLTEGLKSFAGDSLRRALQTAVSGRFSAVVSGALFTAAIQSSTATILTVIGFVSAGLITFTQAIGVTIGATFGTTSTPWLIAVFGFRVRIADGALPLLGVGALLWLVASGRLRSLGAILAGFGLLFTGIDFLQTGMKGVTWNLEAFAGTGFFARWVLAGIGIVMTIVMQSSSAAAATTLVALDAGSLTFEQACAMVVGQSIGTAATSALAALGGGLAVRRTAIAHVTFSLVVGVLGIAFLGPLVNAAEWLGGRLGDLDGVLALAAFSSIFKLAGVMVFYPWLDRFAQFISRIAGSGGETAVSHLEPAVARTGGTIALEAAWRAILEVARGGVDAVRASLAGERAGYVPPTQAIQQIEQFLESVSLDTIDPSVAEFRLVRICHALDDLSTLQQELARIPAAVSDWQPPPGYAEGARALASWLDATKEPETAAGAAVTSPVEKAREQLIQERKAERERLLGDVALRRVPAATAASALESLRWAESALQGAQQLIESLHAARGE